MRAEIRPGKAAGSVAAPPSKSYAHRLLLGGALSSGRSVIRGVVQNEDVSATLDGMAALGASCTVDGPVVTVQGVRKIGEPSQTALPVFPCRESGSTLRFLIPASLVVCGGGQFLGTARLTERGIGVYEEAFADRGIRWEKEPGRITARGKLTAGEYLLRGNVSSQFMTGLLFALPLLEGESSIRLIPPVESCPYIGMTVEVLRRFGITVLQSEETYFRIPGGQRYQAVDETVEGDWSGAAFLYALRELGGDVRVTGLNRESAQGDRICLPYFERLRHGGAEMDLTDCPDLGPVLFALAAAKQGGRFTGTARLRIKESDRAAAMAAELRKFGGELIVGENCVTVEKREIHRPEVPLCGHHDHRIVMALAVLASVTGGIIEGAEAVSKSYPDFFEVLKQLGLEVNCEL